MASKDKEIEELSKAHVNHVIGVYKENIVTGKMNLSDIRGFLRRAFPFGADATDKQKRIFADVVNRAMKEIEAWPKALAMAALIIALSSTPALADDQTIPVQPALKSAKPVTAAGVLMDGLNPDGTVNRHPKRIYQVASDGTVVEVTPKPLKEKIGTAFHWTVRKVRRGCQIANPMLQTGAHLAQIAILFVR